MHDYSQLVYNYHPQAYSHVECNFLPQLQTPTLKKKKKNTSLHVIHSLQLNKVKANFMKEAGHTAHLFSWTVAS